MIHIGCDLPAGLVLEECAAVRTPGKAANNSRLCSATNRKSPGESSACARSIIRSRRETTMTRRRTQVDCSLVGVHRRGQGRPQGCLPHRIWCQDRARRRAWQAAGDRRCAPPVAASAETLFLLEGKISTDDHYNVRHTANTDPPRSELLKLYDGIARMKGAADAPGANNAHWEPARSILEHMTMAGVALLGLDAARLGGAYTVDAANVLNDLRNCGIEAPPPDNVRNEQSGGGRSVNGHCRPRKVRCWRIWVTSERPRRPSIRNSSMKRSEISVA